MASNSWDKFFIDMAEFVSTKSKDRNSKIGAVIVGPDDEVVSIGFNGFPRGVNDNVDSRYERPIKYKFTEHAERNAVYNAARIGVSVKNCNIYLNVSPYSVCSDCTRALIQSGVSGIIGPNNQQLGSQWDEDLTTAHEMLVEYGTAIRTVEV